MKKVYIHIGLNKTGSTFLQSKVFPHLGYKLLTQSSLELIEPYNDLMNQDEFDYNPDPLIQYFNSNFENENLLISDEAIPGRPIYRHTNRFRNAKRLNEIFPNAKILVFIRGQEDIMRSIYSQYVKGRMSGFQSPEQFFISSKMNIHEEHEKKEQILKNYLSGEKYYLEMLEYSKLINMYKSLFKDVEVCLYEDLKYDQKYIINSFNHFFQIKLSQRLENIIKNGASLNTGLSNREIEIRKIANIIVNLPKSSFHAKLIRKLIFYYYRISVNNFSEEDSYKILSDFYLKDNKILSLQVPRILNYSDFYPLNN